MTMLLCRRKFKRLIGKTVHKIKSVADEGKQTQIFILDTYLKSGLVDNTVIVFHSASLSHWPFVSTKWNACWCCVCFVQCSMEKPVSQMMMTVWMREEWSRSAHGPAWKPWIYSTLIMIMTWPNISIYLCKDMLYMCTVITWYFPMFHFRVCFVLCVLGPSIQ